MNNESFPIKAYSVKELACIYFPKSTPRAARTQFMRWLKVSEKLQNDLKEAGHRPFQKLLTPRQVRLIVDHLDPPGE